MLTVNNMRELTPGVFCHGVNCVTVHEEAHTVHIRLLPEKESITTLYFVSQDNPTTKKHCISVDFYEEHAAVHIFGLYQPREKQRVDIQTVMNHFVPHCESKQVWRGVLHDAATGVFDAKIIVHPKAQKTNAELSNKNLLLSKNAQINTKPALEIYVDDVTCSHGATIGFLDESALFYLRSRGIEETIAREMLVQAFVDEVTL